LDGYATPFVQCLDLVVVLPRRRRFPVIDDEGDEDEKDDKRTSNIPSIDG